MASEHSSEGQSSGVAAVNRALTIIDAFRGSEGALTLAELAARTGFYKSTILRLIESLEAFGYMRKSGTNVYRLGPKLIEMATIYQTSFNLEDFVMPALRELVARTRESASFYIREGDQRLCLYRLESPQTVRDHIRVGALLPLDRGAAGLVLLRFSEGGLAARGSSAEDMAIATFGERQPDLAAVASPIFTVGDALAGALSVSGPRPRFTPDVVNEIRKALIDVAARLSRDIGASTDLFAGRQVAPVA
jgi:DNA-binding IclR family transcriptional regulator